MNTFNKLQRKYLLIALIIALGIVLARMSIMIVDGVMGAIVFFVLFRSLHIYFSEKLKINSAVSAILIITLSFLIILVPFLSLTWMMYDKILYYENNPEELGLLRDKLWPLVEKFISDKNNIDELITWTQSKALSVFSGALSSISNIVLQILVMYFLLYFMLKEHIQLENILTRFLPLKKYQITMLGTELTNITYSNILGQGFISFVQGLLMLIGFLIFGLDDPLFWGVVSFFLAFIPFVGPSMVFIPAGLLLIYSGDMFSGVGILLWGFILVTNIDNVIRYYLSKKIGDIHPLITIIGVIIGIPAFGILGLVYGPLLIAYFILLMKIWESDNRR